LFRLAAVAVHALCKWAFRFLELLFVMAGLVPAISLREALHS